ncbi:E3 ubiquitin/ISG15 ligase TRIM25-like isoform X2 [Plectropomus leopardus]|uniref:E3 ubiquitin/ISG15 ligase TRIM25-like isoform X2 n=1 Tax=Plectropomus leopardus TaxID=160734 RepID=UPI001C4C1794|nr:E3 ubiquitin/ISG15 ligase TRIM25-like isoform X2 [Plectropomus leopardus]
MEAEAAILSEASDDTGKQIRSAEEPSLQKDQKESEIQEDEVTNECDPEDQKDTNMRTKDLLITSQRDKRSISPLSFLKEDFSQFKEEVLKVFRDKDTNPTSQAENKPASSTLDLLKEDLSQLKEDVTSVFSSSKETKSTDPKTSLPAEKTINRLSFLNFKDDLSNIFRISLSKERENKDTTAKEDSCSNVKIKPEKVDEPFFQSLFGKPSPKAENGEVKAKTFPETSEEQLDECNTEADNVQKVNNMKDKVEDSEVDLTVSEEKTESVSETQQSEEVIPTLLTVACYLTFDPNTANSELHLTDCNRTATRVWSDHQPSDHPDRFQGCPQVLCREGLLDSVYWEVEWSGGADIGVTYNSISRHGDTANSLLGLNERSWSLECSEGSYTPCHRNRRFRSCSPRPFTHRVGVYLNWSAGSLSFYCVSQDAMVHLHTFTSSFFEPLYPGFWVWAYNGSVSLCQVELDWERLLQ